ncbi:MAG: pro-sigmaK processing inhibitor BofA family protein [Sarcina sp.]
MESIIALVIGLVAAFIIFKIIKGSIKLLINGIVGVIFLAILNFAAAGFGLEHLQIGINVFTALIAGIFGVPGVIVMEIFKFFF